MDTITSRATKNPSANDLDVLELQMHFCPMAIKEPVGLWVGPAPR